MSDVARIALLAWACSVSCLAADLPIVGREQLNATLWLQTATEYQGLALGTYRAAQRILPALRASKSSASVEQELAGKFAKKKPAIVMDIDETVLDNTAYNARLVQRGEEFKPDTFDAWVRAEAAKGIPGAREFIRQAQKLGFRVVFITNRECNKKYGANGRSMDCPHKSATIANLEKELGYRPADEDVLMRHEVEGRIDQDKQERRLETARKYRIAALIGDDLNDFIRRSDYSEKTHGIRWGKQWFALPNPMYGSWERTSYPELDRKYKGLIPWTPEKPVSPP